MILVIGATGLTGSLVLKRLKERQVPVRVLVRSNHHSDDLNILNTDIIYGDLSDTESLRKAMKGVKSIYLVSSIAEEAFELQKNAIDVASELNGPRVVRLSAVGANQKAKPRISRIHGDLDKYLKDSGVDYTILCPHFFMQNLVPQAITIAEDGDLYAPAGDGKIGFIHAEDIADAAVEALLDEKHTGKTYTLTGPEALGFSEVAKSLGNSLNREIQYVDISGPEFIRLALDQGMSHWQAEGVLELYGVFKAGYGKMVSSGVKRITGNPPRSIDDFARSFSSHINDASSASAIHA
jgi:uncharacterized protein YbjT (DUF2867 family)